MMPQKINESDKRQLGAPEKTGPDGPVRQCAVTRERLPQTAMIRFVRSPDGVAVPDVAGKLPGRGVWVTAKRETVEKGLKTDIFSRGFKSRTQAMDELCEAVESQLVHRCIGLIGMAKKSGQAVLGFDQVRAYIRKREPGWLLEASDGAKDGRNKVHFLAKAIYEEAKVAGALSSAELGMAFGREHVIHALLEHGPLAEAFGIAYQRLIGFRLAPETEWFADRR
ncbi:MAG: RNA-binding protein [Pseudomonadota bacterium]